MFSNARKVRHDAAIQSKCFRDAVNVVESERFQESSIEIEMKLTPKIN